MFLMKHHFGIKKIGKYVDQTPGEWAESLKGIKIIKRTNITSTNGVTLISLIGSLEDLLKLKAIFLNYC